MNIVLLYSSLVILLCFHFDVDHCARTSQHHCLIETNEHMLYMEDKIFSNHCEWNLPLVSEALRWRFGERCLLKKEVQLEFLHAI